MRRDSCSVSSSSSREELESDEGMGEVSEGYLKVWRRRGGRRDIIGVMDGWMDGWDGMYVEVVHVEGCCQKRGRMRGIMRLGRWAG